MQVINFPTYRSAINHLIQLACCLLISSLLFNTHLTAQGDAARSVSDPISSPLFASDEILELTLRGDTKTLFNDRSNDALYHKMEISYAAEDGQTIIIPLKVKTRGNFRRRKENCFYPPLLLNFSKKKTPEGSLFTGQDKMKLVTPCRDEDYVVREYLVYKLYNLITDRSFRARLVRVVYADSEKGKDTDPLYGMLLEDEDHMAQRNSCELLKINGLRPNKTEPDPFLTMAVFEFMIGNTDWSVQYRHNVKLLKDESATLPVCVPYDFDHAGIVQAPYAKPAPELKMSSIKERRYRGHCLDNLSELEPVFARFNELREDFYKVYTDCPMLDEKYVRQTVKFLDDFYETINDPKDMAKAFSYPCQPGSTANVVIQGLRGQE